MDLAGVWLGAVEGDYPGMHGVASKMRLVEWIIHEEGIEER
jgi:hypothetical protein